MEPIGRVHPLKVGDRVIVCGEANRCHGHRGTVSRNPDSGFVTGRNVNNQWAWVALDNGGAVTARPTELILLPRR